MKNKNKAYKVFSIAEKADNDTELYKTNKHTA